MDIWNWDLVFSFLRQSRCLLPQDTRMDFRASDVTRSSMVLESPAVHAAKNPASQEVLNFPPAPEFTVEILWFRVWSGMFTEPKVGFWSSNISGAEFVIRGPSKMSRQVRNENDTVTERWRINLDLDGAWFFDDTPSCFDARIVEDFTENGVLVARRKGPALLIRVPAKYRKVFETRCVPIWRFGLECILNDGGEYDNEAATTFDAAGILMPHLPLSDTRVGTENGKDDILTVEIDRFISDEFPNTDLNGTPAWHRIIRRFGIPPVTPRREAAKLPRKRHLPPRIEGRCG